MDKGIMELINKIPGWEIKYHIRERLPKTFWENGRKTGEMCCAR